VTNFIMCVVSNYFKKLLCLCLWGFLGRENLLVIKKYLVYLGALKNYGSAFQREDSFSQRHRAANT
ncbi:hypothetical protein, partial [Flavobacterium lindanitolerans]|uniref:hypothetical protein n=1 Tax=Flavobacterium lindanitolerans TaxID=428988 RepID=UPI0031AAC043